ncbi:MAG: hypothetical protein KatS3mg064_1097 [Tepidiforma sp.]|nr:type II toxin-antitoxin system HicA family toxin [Tepidiforma sp.]GIW17940.1 MAG: hypothetical protein KatS3mg064_1097 [Tepidiforma sp.]
MSRLAGFSARDVARVAEQLGWRLDRQSGSYLVSVHDGKAVTLVIPAHRELRPGTLRALIRATDLDVDRFLELVRG